MILPASILALTKVAADNTVRPALHAVLIKGNKAVATDAYRLVEITLDEPAEKPLLMDINDLKTIKLLAKESQVLNVDTKENSIEYAGNVRSVAKINYLSLNPEEYPDYQQIIPAANNEPITLNLDLLVSTLTTMQKILGKGSQVDFSVNHTDQNAAVRIDGKKVLAVIMPIRK